jgi:hypothetical protein
MNLHQILMHLLIIETHNWMGTTPDWLGLFTGSIGANGRTHGEIRPGISSKQLITNYTGWANTANKCIKPDLLVFLAGWSSEVSMGFILYKPSALLTRKPLMQGVRCKEKGI